MNDRLRSTSSHERSTSMARGSPRRRRSVRDHWSVGGRLARVSRGWAPRRLERDRHRRTIPRGWVEGRVAGSGEKRVCGACRVGRAGVRERLRPVGRLARRRADDGLRRADREAALDAGMGSQLRLEGIREWSPRHANRGRRPRLRRWRDGSADGAECRQRRDSVEKGLRQGLRRRSRPVRRQQRAGRRRRSTAGAHRRST